MFAWNLLKSGAGWLVGPSSSSSSSVGLSTLAAVATARMTTTPASKLLWPSLGSSGLLAASRAAPPQTNQVRNWGYNDRMTLRDIKRREILRKFAPERVRLQTIKANNVLPKTLKQMALEQLQKYPKDSAISRINNRCAFTSKPGGLMHRWRLSRHVWRDQADYNMLSGVMRSSWGTPTRNSVAFTFKKFWRSWFNYDGTRAIRVIDRKSQPRTYQFKNY